jgi:Predicted membrane protein (DUF2339)
VDGLIPALFLAALLFVASPIMAIVALVRASRLNRQVTDLQAELRDLEARVGAPPVAPPEPWSAPAPSPVPAAPPVITVPAPAPMPTVSPAPTLSPPPEPGPPVTPPLPAPPAPPPVPEPLPEPVSTWSAPAAPPPPPGEAGAEPPPGPPAPSRPGFDWESLLGLKGAAWAGGIAFVIAGILLAKLAIDRGVITPEVRVALMLVAGVGALVWAELSLRKGYSTTANSVSGAGIAILYIAFFAAHSLFHLVGLGPTFALMALVTVLAGVVAVRYDAMFTAALGILGGFATPIVLSTGEDRPVALFAYLILLNLGVLAIGRRRGWSLLVVLALAGTVIIEVGWFGKYMAPGKMLVGLGAFLALGLLYAGLPLIAREPGQETLLRAGVLGGIVPFVFSLVLARRRAYAGEWPLLFGYVGLLDAALVAVALLRHQLPLLLGGAVATAMFLPLWADKGLSPAALWGPSLAAIVLAALLNAPARLARRLAPGVLEESRGLVELAGLIAGGGLGLFTLVLVVRGLGEPPWVFLVLLAALTGLLLERSGDGRLPGVRAAGPVALAVLAQVWFFEQTGGATLLRNLAVPLLLAMVFSLASARRAAQAAPPARFAAVSPDDDELGVAGATLVALVGLFLCLPSPELARDPWPLFTALAVVLALLVVSALRRDWTELVVVALVAAAAFATLWHEVAFRLSHFPAILAAYAGLYLAFLVLPFVLPASMTSGWRERPLPWVTSALAGPAFFLVLYRAVVAGWGKAWIAVLPVLLAALSVAALAGVSRRFPPGGPERARKLRLDYLALFAALALGFVALAIPLQVGRQWITLGWALEAAAVWWLFGRLPHPGLKYFGAILYVLVGVRLLANLEVLTYGERGLPILNWLLYTYGVPALCAFAGAAWLARAEAARGAEPAHDVIDGDRRLLAPGAAALGLLLVFWLLNLEIIDFFSAGRYVELSVERHFSRDLTMSVAWGLYALGLLLVGLWRKIRPVRYVSLGFLVLTAAKVFLYDLSALEGVYRILSFFGLGVALILVSLLYQRFVVLRERLS